VLVDSEDSTPSKPKVGELRNKCAGKMPTLGSQVLPETWITHSPSNSVSMELPNMSATGFKLVVKNTFIDIVPEEGIDAANRGAQTCQARLLEPSPPSLIGKPSGDFSGGEHSTTYSDGSSTWSELGEDSPDEMDLYEVQFHDYANSIMTPTAWPCVSTSSTKLSGCPISFENPLGIYSGNKFENPFFLNGPVDGLCAQTFTTKYDMHMPPAPPMYAPLAIIGKEPSSLHPEPPLGVNTLEPAIESTGISANTNVAPSEGSKQHGTVTTDGRPGCQPCAWFCKGSGCKNGAACKYCHLCPPGEMKNRKKQKIALLRGHVQNDAEYSSMELLHVT